MAAERFHVQVASDMVAAVASEAEPLPPTVVETRGLDTWYGDFQALRKINFAAAKGRITAIIGPSGCGKSTLVRAINRMNDLVPGYRASGDILIDGSPAPTDPAGVIALRRHVGMLFQRPNPFPSMTIAQNVLIDEEGSAKVRTGPPVDDAAELSLPGAEFWFCVWLGLLLQAAPNISSKLTANTATRNLIKPPYSL